MACEASLAPESRQEREEAPGCFQHLGNCAASWIGRGGCSLDKHRTLVLCKHSLFGQALKTLLDNQEGIELVGVEVDESRARESIRILKPDIVVVETGEEGVPVEGLLSYVVRESPESRIVGLSQGQNEIDVYYGHQRRVRQAEDLLEVIAEL